MKIRGRIDWIRTTMGDLIKGTPDLAGVGVKVKGIEYRVEGTENASDTGCGLRLTDTDSGQQVIRELRWKDTLEVKNG
jgi:hypothetical protein